MRRKAKKKDYWEDDKVQFARLVSELFAVCNITSRDWMMLQASMNLTGSEILEIRNRADAYFEKVKEKICPRK